MCEMALVLADLTTECAFNHGFVVAGVYVVREGAYNFER